MSDDFDPYQRWLGIPPREQPPNYYRLLTLEPLEANHEVIDSTSAKLTAYLEARSNGKNAAHALRLLEEVAAARACLLDPESKSVYDSTLQPPVKPASSAAIAPDDSPNATPPHDDMSFLDGISYTGPGATAARSASGGLVGTATKGKFIGASQTNKGTPISGFGRPSQTQRWQPQPWQLGAMVGGGALLVIAMIAVVLAMQGASGPDQPQKNPVANQDTPPDFGPQTVNLAKMQDEAAAKRKIPLGRASVSAPIRRQGDYFFTAVTINGQPAGDFLIDTGAAATTIKSSLAERLKLPGGDKAQRIRAVGGGQTASFRKTTTLNIGEAKFDDLQLVVIDLAPWEKQVGARFDGVLGCDIWREMMFCIDPRQSKLTFYDRDTKNPMSDKAEFLTVMDDRPFIAVRLDGGEEVQYMAATGCAADLMSRPAKETEQGGASDAAPLKPGFVRVLGQSLENLSTATGRADDVYITSDPRQAGVVGSRVLAQFKLVMDFQRNKVAAQRIAGK
jgi:predicted aspartyl protease